ncbi:unnamed protein product [Adineta steineri]|uniref:Glucuronosyltransferase n=2 Tax=Adineta steineri TaxID=433720 RepID=A0A819ZIS6_9BILA|nr:unnamed protein product [Adineta steineri]
MKLFLILLSLLLFDGYATTTNNTALFITIPFIGHVNPLIAQALELRSRGWNVYILSCSDIKNYVEEKNIEFIDIGHCAMVEKVEYLQQKIMDIKAFSNDFDLVIKWALNDYSSMYKASIKVLKEKQLNVTVAVTDMGTLAGTDICYTLNISCIINNADILPFLDGSVNLNLEDFKSVIVIFSAIFFRTFFKPFISLIFRLFLYLRYDSHWNKLRKENGLTNPTGLFRRTFDHIVLCNVANGLERPRSLPPNFQLTGPMLNMKLSKDVYINSLSEEDRNWIELDNETSMIYVSAGTVASLTKEQVEKLLQSFSTVKYRVIWKLGKKDAQHLVGKTIPKSIRIVNWISSALGHLAHPNIKLFVSHCGINSVYESLWLGTPIICLPMFGDQYSMANQVRAAGVGEVLNKFKFTSNELSMKIDEVLTNQTMIKNIQRLQVSMKLHGGVHRAANIIEGVAQSGPENFLSKTMFLPWYRQYHFDTYLLCWEIKMNNIKMMVIIMMTALFFAGQTDGGPTTYVACMGSCYRILFGCITAGRAATAASGGATTAVSGGTTCPVVEAGCTATNAACQAACLMFLSTPTF